MASVKFSDLMKTRLTGPDVEYTDWLRRFEDFDEVVIKATKASDQDALTLLQAWLEGPCQEEAEEFLRKWEGVETVPTTGSAMRSYYKHRTRKAEPAAEKQALASGRAGARPGSSRAVSKRRRRSSHRRSRAGIISSSNDVHVVGVECSELRSGERPTSRARR